MAHFVKNHNQPLNTAKKESKNLAVHGLFILGLGCVCQCSMLKNINFPKIENFKNVLLLKAHYEELHLFSTYGWGR